MADSGSIGGGSPIQPTEPSQPSGASGEPSGENIASMMSAPVKTLGQLKQVMISHLGEKNGTKLYNNFLNTFCMEMISQIQHSAAQAKKAAQQMQNPGG